MLPSGPHHRQLRRRYLLGVLILGEQVAVSVKRLADGGVPQALLNDLCRQIPVDARSRDKISRRSSFPVYLALPVASMRPAAITVGTSPRVRMFGKPSILPSVFGNTK